MQTIFSNKVAKRSLGYVVLNPKSDIPETLEDVDLKPNGSGPINTLFEKPFRVWESIILIDSSGVTSEALLSSLQGLIRVATHSIMKARGVFVLYLEQHSSPEDTKLLGGLYKIGK
jgi:hypothetical protein